jgi:hypothetical protein
MSPRRRARHKWGRRRWPAAPKSANGRLLVSSLVCYLLTDCHVSYRLTSGNLYFYGDWSGGTDNKYGNLAKEWTFSLLLLSTSSSSYLGGEADFDGGSKELFFNRQLFERPSFLEVK